MGKCQKAEREDKSQTVAPKGILNAVGVDDDLILTLDVENK